MSVPDDGSNGSTFDSGGTPEPGQTDQLSDTPKPSPPGPSGPNRRDFLKAAVVGSAAVVAAGSATAAALSLSAKRPGPILRLVSQQISSEPCTACVTGSTMDATDALNFDIDLAGHASHPSEFYIWLTSPRLPAGPYGMRLGVGETLCGQPSGCAFNLGDADAPFTYHGTGAVHQYNPLAAVTCPPIPTFPAPEIFTTDDIHQGDWSAFHHPGGDFQIGVHLDYSGGKLSSTLGVISKFTFVWLLTSGTSGMAVCGGLCGCASDRPLTYTITGHQIA